MHEESEPDPITYDEKTPFYKTDLSDSVMPEGLRIILWAHRIEELGVLYLLMSNFPDPLQTICTILDVDFDDLKQELTDRLPTKFLMQAHSDRDLFQLILNPASEALSRYTEYLDLLAVPGVIGLREYEDFSNGKTLGVYLSLSRSDATTALLLPPVHPKSGLPIVLHHEH